MVRSHRMCVVMYVPVAQTLTTDRRFLLQNCGNPMMVFWLLVFSLFALQVHAATIEQTTARRCSPAVGQANNVTIVCQRVDPKALARLNELLDKQDLELQAKIGEAEEWAQTYNELKQQY